MLVRLTKKATISGVDYPVGCEVAVRDSTGEYLLSVDSCEKVEPVQTHSAVADSSSKRKSRIRHDETGE